MMDFLRKITPAFAMRAYHRVRSFAAAVLYGFPARRMIVVGITGTKGKTSTGNYIWSVLTAGGYAAGLLSSANFRIGRTEEPNTRKMTMPDSFFIQKRLRMMRKKNIEIAVIEMTSEGMKYFRHTGIPVDIAVFTNLTPEHLRSHKNDFEVYKKAKSPLFRDALDHAARAARHGDPDDDPGQRRQRTCGVLSFVSGDAKGHVRRRSRRYARVRHRQRKREYGVCRRRDWLSAFDSGIVQCL